MHTLGLSPSVTIETRSHQHGIGHGAKQLIRFRYPSATHTHIWDSIRAHNRNAPPEKVAHTLALSADPRDRLVVNG